MPTPAPTRAAHLSVSAAALVVLGLGGCSGEARPAVTASPASVPVLQPGRPGEPNATLTGEAATPVVRETASAEDTRFLQDMVVHHAQAIVLVETVGDRFEDPQVASLASRIRDEQGPEISFMATWLEARGQAVPPEATNPRLTDHGSHRGMPGMAGESELDALSRAAGAEADRMFLTLMVRHHEGALEMVDEHAGVAAEATVGELADEIAVTQTKQISQMRAMLERLG
ncbi:DUF305 domain-containing protein [Phycicoccus sp. CSK15P-2]|uniref:DUF305 domain-containing protein n=1 Tax=Phycicoccus sp. CSK15P-2 TaxID=2807627 RepID=UPI0019500349|nr:DUF305 domain-containing protein [Phycicoccus sp. CSK15P-2]MBM6403559.1 DUF305 domain-containing protein [Phycicoccus sp. CSK15P-2]